MQKNGSIYINTNRTIVFSLQGLLEEGRTKLTNEAPTLAYTPFPMALLQRKDCWGRGVLS